MVIVKAGFFREFLREADCEAYIVIDVLRFTTTVSLALAAGVERVVFYSDYNSALEYSRRNCIPLAAEIEGFKPPTADYDNSPVEVYLAARDYGFSEIVLRSTSGAYVLEEAYRRRLRNVYLSAMVNAGAVAEEIVSRGFKSVCIVMAGFRRKRFSLDDMLGAGALIWELGLRSSVKLESDEAVAALALWKYYDSGSSVLDAVKTSRAGLMLIRTGREYDIEVSCRVNSVSVVPKLTSHWRYIIESR